jgi:ESCRT-II complex subunit VPS22
LGIQIIEASIASRTNDGGLTELNEIMRRVEVMRGRDIVKKKEKQTQQISEDDIVRAIKTLKPLSGGYEVLQIGNRKLVRSVPKELDKDQSSLLLLAQVIHNLRKGRK